MSRNPESIIFRGYVKKENGHWVAICIDLNIVAQGNSIEKAREECESLIIEYLDYICSEYPKEFYKYIQRPAPKELVEEFNLIMGRQLKAHKRSYSENLQYYDIAPSSLPLCTV